MHFPFWFIIANQYQTHATCILYVPFNSHGPRLYNVYCTRKSQYWTKGVSSDTQTVYNWNTNSWLIFIDYWILVIRITWLKCVNVTLIVMSPLVAGVSTLWCHMRYDYCYICCLFWLVALNVSISILFWKYWLIVWHI